MFYTDVMAAVGIRELNQQTSQILNRVRAGETIEVTDRGVPIAEIRPVGREQSALARLVAEGRLTRRRSTRLSCTCCRRSRSMA